MLALRSRPRLWLGAQVVCLAAVCAAGVAASVALLRAPSTGRARAVAPRGPPESMFHDDQLLIDSPTATVTRTLDQLRALGVDRLRLTILWASIAPDPLAAHPPAGFDPSRPAAYPAVNWAPYDRVLELARARGIGVDFDLTAPGPRWAMATGARWLPRPITTPPRHGPSAPSWQRSGAATAGATARPGRRQRCRAWPSGRFGTSPTSLDGWRPNGRPAEARRRSPPPGSTAGMSMPPRRP